MIRNELTNRKSVAWTDKVQMIQAVKTLKERGLT